jgi:hypothetical protein
MIQPNPSQRITAQMAHHHHALDSAFEMDMSTPPFVRTAASLPVEPREKKQVPREQRDQKRSQALQAETGAKFVNEASNAKPEIPQKKQKEAIVKVVPRLNDIAVREPEVPGVVVTEQKAIEQCDIERDRVEDVKQSSVQKKGKTSSYYLTWIGAYLCLFFVIDLSPHTASDLQRFDEEEGKRMMFC